MNKIKIALLKNNLSRHLATVRQGGEIVVMDRNTPVARIIPYGPREAPPRTSAKTSEDDWSTTRMAELVRQGTVQPGTPRGLADWLGRSRPARLPKGASSPLAALIRARRESSR